MTNQNKVNKKVWNSWSEKAQGVFNDSYKWYRENQDKMVHPKSTVIEVEHWDTISWNAAWIASSYCDEVETVIVGK